MLVNMNDVLLSAKEGKYGVGFFDTVNVEMAKAVIETAEELNAPVMIGTAEILLPFMSLKNTAEFLIPMAKEAKVPVCVHYDHGLTFDKCMEALKLGYSSLMYDCSSMDYESNLSNMKKMAEICRGFGVTLEAELGHVGDNEGAGKLARPEDYYTDPVKAKEFAEETGIDSLAVAVGNAHGDYKFTPKLDFERIETIARETGLPLVLHGGSGLSDSDFRTAVSRGICKINIFTDLDKAGKKGIEKGIAEGKTSLTGLLGCEIEAMKVVVREKIELFGSVGKARP